MVTFSWLARGEKDNDENPKENTPAPWINHQIFEINCINKIRKSCTVIMKGQPIPVTDL